MLLFCQYIKKLQQTDPKLSKVSFELRTDSLSYNSAFSVHYETEKISLSPKTNMYVRCHGEVRSTTHSLKACFPLFFTPSLSFSFSLSFCPASTVPAHFKAITLC